MPKKLQLLLSILLGILVVVLIFNTSFVRRNLTHLEMLWRDLIFPLQKAFSIAGGALANAWDRAVAVREITKEAAELKAELERTKFELEGLKEIRLENDRLKELLALSGEDASLQIFAKVIGKDPRDWLKTIVIDKGAKDGLQIGTPIVTYKGVVGHITSTTRFTSQVTLLLDPKVAIGGIIQRTRDFVIVEKADVSGVLEVTPLYQKEKDDAFTTSPVIDFKEGDTVITSGFGSIYPKGLHIGVITEIRKDNKGIKGFLVPSVDFGRLEEVCALMPIHNQKEDEL